MEPLLNMLRELFRSRRSTGAAIALTLFILGAAIFAVQMVLRHKMRVQMARQEAELFQAVVLMQQNSDAAAGVFTGPVDEPESYFDEVLKVSKLRGVLAVRLFDKDGNFRAAFPSLVSEGSLDAEDLERLRRSEPVSHFRARAPLEEVDLLGEGGGTVALLEVTIALPNQAGAAQFVIQGQTLAAAYGDLDRNLFFDSGTIFLACGSLVAWLLGLAFHRIRRMNRQLLEANRELALAAKTTAVGAVASHLIHGLRNPLSGLKSFVGAKPETQGGGMSAEDWAAAFASTERMECLVNEVIRILQEQQAGVHYEISVPELLELTLAKIRPVAGAAGVRVESRANANVNLSSRDANLIVLILENLLQNALQATPQGKAVGLSVTETTEALSFEVADQGSGLSEKARGDLFKPCRSTKPGGGGIGLAICQQLATQLNAQLLLKSSTGSGCVFLLCLPKVREPKVTAAASNPLC